MVKTHTHPQKHDKTVQVGDGQPEEDYVYGVCETQSVEDNDDTDVGGYTKQADDAAEDFFFF